LTVVPGRLILGVQEFYAVEAGTALHINYALPIEIGDLLMNQQVILALDLCEKTER